MDGSIGAKARFLFLQGMASQFFSQLGDGLAQAGHDVHRINFNGGDRLFWRLPGAVDYRDDLAAWPEFLAARLREWRITDIVLFGDCRPLHKVAVTLAEQHGVRIHVFEEGYLRPNWITLERSGVNGHSHLIRDPSWFIRAARVLPAWHEGEAIRGYFARRAAEDVAYNTATVLMAWRYRGYRTHRPWHPFVEYAGWLGRFMRQFLFAKARLAQAMQKLNAAGEPYFLFPLQLDCDVQIRQHSGFKRLAPAIEQVIDSFAERAPADTLLVLKEHPLDNGLQDWRRLVQRLAARAGVADRVIYVDGGDLEQLVKRATGVITVNSTAGVRALANGIPLIALGNAIYDMPGLTLQHGLERFWWARTAPDPVLYDAFRRVLRDRCLVNGGFFSADAIEFAVAESILRLTAPGFADVSASGVVHPDASPDREVDLSAPNAALA